VRSQASRFGLAALMLAAFAGSARAQDAHAAERARVIHLLQRATFGVTPEAVGNAEQLGREAWLEQQLQPSRIADTVAQRRLTMFPLLREDMGQLLAEFEQVQRERRMRAADSTRTAGSRPANNPRRMDDARRMDDPTMADPQLRRLTPQMIAVQLVSAKLTRAVYSERQLEEVLTDFWFNHFNVHIGKGITRFLIPDYEANVIRPHVFGRFRDLLGATAKHPAMLFYLDNAGSVAVDSTRPLPRTRERGLNENYARELLELHTLGVDGGYTQDDVVAVARALTGWSFTRPNPRSQTTGFVFRPMLHDRGEKVVLGHRLPAGRGIEDGEEVLDIVASHPATARFIAFKLVERFVSDEPDTAFVRELAAVFTRTGGDLREVTRALFSSPRFYATDVLRAKVKTPFELVASAFRATRAEVGVSRQTIATLRGLGHLPYNESTPAGYPVASADWVNSGAMLNRMNFALALGANRLQGVRVAAMTADSLDVVLARVLPGVDAAALRTVVLREGEGSPARTLGLVLGSPEFQRK